MIRFLFRTYVWPYRLRFFLGLLLLVFNSYLTSVMPLYLMKIIDNGIIVADKTDMYRSVAVYIGVFALYVLSLYIMTIQLERLGQDILIRLKTESFKRVLSWDYRMFTDVSPGKLVTRIEGDPEKVRFFFVTASVTVLQSVFMLAFMMAIMFHTNSRLAAVVVYPMPLLVILMVFLHKYIFPMFKKVRRLMADITSKITEYLSGLDIIKSFAEEELFFRKFDRDNKKKYVLERNAEFGWIAFFNIMFMMQEVIIALIFRTSGPMIMKGLLTYGVLIMFIEYVRMFFFPLIGISEQISQIQRAMAAFSRVYELHTADINIRGGKKTMNGMTQSISFEHVDFAYNEDETVLSDVCFQIPAGQKWALVGETGGGKSTIIRLLLRFYDVKDGSIKIDGADIREFRIDELRKDIALIEQDFFLFPATVLDNLRLFDDKITAEEVESVCRDSGIHDFIMSLPDGYLTDLHEEGGNLSVGERQLLSIARAMVKKADIVLMDEATSSIDPHTERRLENAIRRLLKGRTSIVVAHRLTTVMDSDMILVVGGGRIMEQGTHDELYSQKGAYFRLCEKQLNNQNDAEILL